MWLIIGIGAINFALIGRVKEFRDENFIVFKRISLLITALCSINFIYSAKSISSTSLINYTCIIPICQYKVFTFVFFIIFFKFSFSYCILLQTMI